ncbi:hypothetical protein DYB25_009329 [Aphanomyces astaci]|uniref:Uncharacterized protein n=1 Tax=Aphanomyces astaci TaxID=112090 RepID=A0A397CWI9_APHAT|nr:hypothetical protein DYB25_009329 [Aphanomyces astaci]RHY21688.1 hypothetical protein DYB36_011554 [Aphanomyces astaci]RHY50707.1 hypothetical protein DYB38_009305 [Aphanomyces astaci]RHY61901.1 hypothetical protein DYB30_008609 [Aphanomyces astaci]RHY69140.1 hypothetical protein DYB34_008256 [Aphanomyces astaci]
MTTYIPSCSQQTIDVPTPKAKPSKRNAKKEPLATKRSVRWGDESVAALFRLRYSSHLTTRFDSKNNAEKKTAYVMLATELSVVMESEYDVAQVQDKVHKFDFYPSLT